MVSIDIDVVCNICGKAVEADHSQGEITVDPCESCLKAEWNEGYDTREEEEE